MNALLNAGLIRDASLFAGAFAGIYAIKFLHKPARHEALSPYPLVRDSPFAPSMIGLLNLKNQSAQKEILELVERFLVLVKTNDLMKHGFEVNRMATEIPEKVKHFVVQSRYSRDSTVAAYAMDFERDELEQIGGICDNIVRNMLLDGMTYA